jgi:hypothetical protein
VHTAHSVGSTPRKRFAHTIFTVPTFTGFISQNITRTKHQKSRTSLSSVYTCNLNTVVPCVKSTIFSHLWGPEKFSYHRTDCRVQMKAKNWSTETVSSVGKKTSLHETGVRKTLHCTICTNPPTHANPC